MTKKSVKPRGKTVRKTISMHDGGASFKWIESFFHENFNEGRKNESAAATWAFSKLKALVESGKVTIEDLRPQPRQ